MSNRRKASGDGKVSLFPNSTSPAGDDSSLSRIVGSALWAAYGDALGFITELADAKTLSHRLGGSEPLVTTRQWRRRIGGRQGVMAVLPEGCYSDDTQLRLSTGRAMGPDGFDVEAFAKVELTVFPAYGLGAGRGTKTAAANLTHDAVPWYANTFKGWTKAGGNGAAMRIQPHIWAAPDLSDPSAAIMDVVLNAICSHSSPTGILGAVFHALVLAEVLKSGSLQSAAQARRCLRRAKDVPQAMLGRSELQTFWLGLWEQDAGRPFAEAWSEEIKKAEAMLSAAEQAGSDYERVLRELDLFNPQVRGSGLLTAIAAVALTWAPMPPDEALLKAVQLLGSDTDTIATMAGAMFGAAPPHRRPPGTILDADLIEGEAHRLAGLATGASLPGHRYPDLLRWSPPKTQADALATSGDDLIVAGLGEVTALQEQPLGPSGDFLWQWVHTEYGQTLLMKRRRQLPEIPHPRPAERQTSDMHGSSAAQLERPNFGVGAKGVEQPLFRDERRLAPLDRGVNIETVLSWLTEKGLDDQSVGYAVRRVARDGNPEQLIMFMGILREWLRKP